MNPPSIEIIAHRGFSANFPENTIAALEGALDAGAVALEWDVRVTADGTPVLFHDDRLDRTTDGSGDFSEVSMERLAHLDAGSWFSPQFVGTRISTLEEVLHAIEPRVERIYPELKGVRSPSDLDTILRLLRESGLHSRTILISLDHAILEQVRARDSEIFLGWVVSREEDMDGCAGQVARDGRAILDPAARLLLDNPDRTKRLTATIPLATWTVDDPAEASALLDLGVRRITTNQVARLLAWAQGAEERAAG